MTYFRGPPRSVALTPKLRFSNCYWLRFRNCIAGFLSQNRHRDAAGQRRRSVANDFEPTCEEIAGSRGLYTCHTWHILAQLCPWQKTRSKRLGTKRTHFGEQLVGFSHSDLLEWRS